jgi:hypothetical protein
MKLLAVMIKTIILLIQRQKERKCKLNSKEINAKYLNWIGKSIIPKVEGLVKPFKPRPCGLTQI